MIAAAPNKKHPVNPDAVPLRSFGLPTPDSQFAVDPINLRLFHRIVTPGVFP
jgi:hypothetical protein